MKKQILVLTCIGLISLPVWGNHAGEHHHKQHDMSGDVQLMDEEFTPSTNQIVLKVDGVVCSFCAYGLEKSISKLPFVEKSLFGGDGVFVDVNKGIITVAINPKEKIDILGTVKAITKAGYVAREIHMLVSGHLEITKKETKLRDNRYVQTFLLTQETGEAWKATHSKPVTLYVVYPVSKKIESLDVLPVIVVL